MDGETKNETRDPFAGEANLSVGAPVRGASNVNVTWPGGARLLVWSDIADRGLDPETVAREIAARVAGRSHLYVELRDVRAELEAVKADRDRALAALPPPAPAKLLGAGAVREDPHGRGLWLLSNAHAGWSAFGFRLDGWDDLFRRYDVRIGKPEIDSHGQWWPAEPRR